MKKSGMTVCAILIGTAVLALLLCSHAQDTSASRPGTPEQLAAEVYCCSVQIHRPWVRRSHPPDDYNPDRFSAHVEVYLPELGVAYLPASDSIVTVDPKRYTQPTTETVGPESLGPPTRTIRAQRVPELTLTSEARKRISQKYGAVLRGTPNKTPAGDVLKAAPKE